MRPSPGLVLAVMVVLLCTQLTRIAAPDRGPWAWTFLLSTAGLIGGEVIAGSGHLAAPAVGALHPVADLLVIAALQTLGLLLLGPRQRRRD